MSASFAELFEESLKTIDMRPGAIVTGVVLDIDEDWVTVHAGLKSEGIIPREQFLDERGECTLQIGDEVQVRSEERRVGKECRSRWGPCRETERERYKEVRGR